MMNWFRNISIGIKLAGGFVIMLIISTLIGLIGIISIQAVEVVDKEMYEVNTVPLGEIGQVAMAYHRIRVNLEQAILENDMEKKNKYAKEINDLLKVVDQELNSFEKSIRSDDIRQEYDQLIRTKEKWVPALNEVIKLIIIGDNEAAYALYSGTGNQISAVISQSIDQIIELKTAQGGQQAASNSQVAKSAVQNMVILLITAIIGAFFLALFITRQITKPVKSLQKLMAKVEQGDLTAQGKLDSKDEMGQLTESLNKLIAVMRHMTQDIYDTTAILNKSSNNMLAISEVVAANSEEMSAVVNGANDAANGITGGVKNGAAMLVETSGNINLISIATEEISATTRSLAAASEQASVNLAQVTSLVEQISGGISIVAGSAKDVSSSVSNVVTAVKEINMSLNDVGKNCERSISVAKEAEMRAEETSVIIGRLNNLSKHVGKIVTLIDDIADQTNMLALNAAIEAAGAGEAGRGFAVVANEVKELAKQTARATSEIANQIETMQAEMADAVTAVAGISQVISKINDSSNNIAIAVTEQSAVVNDISTAVVIAAEKVNLISNEIGDIAEKSRIVARSATESTQGVRETARSVAELSMTAGELAKTTESASQQMGEVAKSSQMISVNVEEISRSIGEISKASDDTAAKGAETRQAADDLVKVSTKLEQLLKRYKI